jgi:hypothetical protein
MKVYCSDCWNFSPQNFLPSYYAPPLPEMCCSPNNIIEVIDENWRGRSALQTSKKHPSILNKNNDCKWYSERGKEKNEN